MSAFRDMVAVDMDTVFFNPDEFAEEHDLNGMVCRCVIQNFVTREKFLQQEKYKGYEAIHGAMITVHVKKDDIAEMPIEGQKFTVDGEIFEVSNCTEQMGMLAIALNANISGWG